MNGTEATPMYKRQHFSNLFFMSVLVGVCVYVCTLQECIFLDLYVTEVNLC